MNILILKKRNRWETWDGSDKTQLNVLPDVRHIQSRISLNNIQDMNNRCSSCLKHTT